jgi:hypothetical protein
MPNEEGQGWQRAGNTGRFSSIALPMSRQAVSLLGDGAAPDHAFYAEFDTTHEPESWRAFLMDPLTMLRAEGLTLPHPYKDGRHGHLEIEIFKLEQSPGMGDFDPGYVDAMKARELATHEMLEAYLEEHGPLTPEEREQRHVSTTVINHEIGLNPRIGTARF